MDVRPGYEPELPQAFAVASLAQALLALDSHPHAHPPARPPLLVSPAAAGAAWGVAWFSGLIGAVRAARPGVEFRAALDCGTAAGVAALACGAGFEVIIFTGTAAACDRLRAIGKACGTEVYARRPPLINCRSCVS